MRVLKHFWLIVLWVGTNANAQFTVSPVNYSNLELRVDGDGETSYLYSSTCELTYSQSYSKLILYVFTESLSENYGGRIGWHNPREGLYQDMNGYGYYDPMDDTTLILVEGIVALDAIKPQGNALDMATFQIPGYLNYKGIQHSIMIDYYQGNSSTSNQVYLNLSFRFQNDENDPIRFSMLPYLPTDLNFKMEDARMVIRD